MTTAVLIAAVVAAWLYAQRRLAPLLGEGWTVLHDRRLPRGRANVDHLLVSPSGRVILLDTKRWSARYPLAVHDRRLLHGQRDVTRRLVGLRYETDAVAITLGVPVTPLVVMDGPPIPVGELVLDGVLIVPADRTLDVVRQLGRGAGTRPALEVAHLAALLLPPYTANTR